MTIPIQRAQAALAEFGAPRTANLFAQAQAKHVLHEVRELPANFPAFDPALDEKVTFAAYSILAAACSVVEQGDRTQGVSALERAASLLQYVHGPHAIASRESGFHVFIAAMAFFAAGQYSRAFVAIRGVEQHTLAAQVVGAFLRKDTASLVGRLNEVLLRAPNIEDDQLEINERAITVAIARAISIISEFTFSGTEDAFERADQQLQDAAIVSSAGSHPAWWWIIRLLRLMLGDLREASLWNALPPFFGHGFPIGLERYIRLLAFGKPPVTELWALQRAALPLALNLSNPGAVVNLRTGAGKTRVAELAILQTLTADSSAKVIYLAPFRSLALEVEHALGATFGWLGHRVSHLYGGSRVSSVDTELAAESSIMIATPEKARALFRASPELFTGVKLVIVDEGHLIGPSERYVRNEVFIDHLRYLSRATGARILLLSAVLPNPQELAEWVTGDASLVARSTWKASAERFGLLRWNGSRVRIDWQGEVASFNPSCVEAKRLGFGRRRKPFPADKNEAVAATAVRLSKIGPVMIFTGRAGSVPTLAKAVLLALGETPADHPWPDHEWKVFDAVCQEDLTADAIELRAARAGVVCHSNRLTPQVRLALEHLMRSKPPRIIVATTTLAQGVNVGISSVIVATPYISNETINKRDFWNICGRAGRAYVDGEGKILYAIDDTRERWQIEKDEQLARRYFNAGTADPVESGLLFAVRRLREMAAKAGASFDLLLELAANNDFSPIGGHAAACAAICDLVDDELLALDSDPLVNPDEGEPEAWVEKAFRQSLAVIQARSGATETKPEDVISFLRARAESARQRVTKSARKAVVSSGLPLSVALKAQEHLSVFSGIAERYLAEAGSIPALTEGVRTIEAWARVHAAAVTDDMPAEARLDAIREGWLRGVGLRELNAIDSEARSIARELYGYQLPWIIHAAAQQLRAAERADNADALGKIALLVDLGVPTETAARMFLAGMRSRVAATELAGLGIDLGVSVSEISRRLQNEDVVDLLRPLVSPPTGGWLGLIVADAARRKPQPIPQIPAFTLSGSEPADVVHARKIGDRVFLTTVDGAIRVEITPSDEFPFDKVVNDPRVAFIRAGEVWNAVVRDPRLPEATT
jgi:hypothetical protein